MKSLKFCGTLLSLILILLVGCEKDIALTPNENFAPNAGAVDDPSSTNGDSTSSSGNGGSSSSLVVEKRQRAVVTYIGATWCPPCGAYGDPAKIHMESTHNSDVIILNVQAGDAISAAGSFGDGFGRVFENFVNSGFIPVAFWSGANFSMAHRGFSTSFSSNNSNSDRDINAIKGDNPDMGIAASAIISGDSIKVETLTKFYTAASEAYIGVYVLEDGVEAMQQITGSPSAITSHENVIRGAVYEGNDLGADPLGTNFSVDQEVVGNYSVAIPNTVLDRTKLQIAVVVWESNDADGISNAILVDAQ